MTPDETEVYMTSPILGPEGAVENVRNALTILLYSGTHGPLGKGGRWYDGRDVNAICARLERAIAQLTAPRDALLLDEFDREISDHQGDAIP